MTQKINWWQIIAVLILVAGAVITIWSAQQQEMNLRTELLIQTRLAEQGISTGQVTALSGSTSDLTSTEYRVLKEQLERMRASVPLARFAYLMGQRTDGTIFFYADSEPPQSADYSPPGQNYTEASDSVKQVFATGVWATEGPAEDRWGTWVSGFVPVNDLYSGKVIAIFGMDVDATNWNLEIIRACLPTFIATLLILLLVLVTSRFRKRSEDEKDRIAKSEEKFREKEAFQRVLLDNLTSGIIIVDAKTHIIDLVNPAASALIGTTPDQIIGKKCHLFLCPAKEGACPITDLHKDVENAERVMLRSDGSTVPVLKSVKKIQIDGREKLLENFIDISKRKDAEAALQRQSALLLILNDIISAANKADDLPHLLTTILDDSLSLLDFDAGGIYVADQSARTARIVHSKNLPPGFLDKIEKISIDKPPYDALFIKNEPIFTENYEQIAPELSKKFGFQSMASIPLLAKGVTIGALNIASKKRHVISGEEKQILLSIGRELGSTIDRMASEEEVRKASRNLEILFNSIDDMVFVLDMRGRILAINSAVQKRLLYTSSELAGTNVLTLHVPERRDEALHIIQAMIAGTTDSCPVPLLVKGGQRIDVETKIARGMWNNQEVLFGVSRDITERKRAEEELHQLSDRLLLATRAGGVGIWDLDVVNDTLTWDDEMFALYGISREQFSGAYEAWQSGVHPDDRTSGDAKIQMALKGEKEFDTEFRVLWPDGTIRNIRALAIVQRDANGNPLRMIGTNWDITEQKNAERELKRSEEKYRLLIENSHDIIYTINSSGIFTFVSPGWTALLGHSASRVVGKPFQQFVHPEDVARCEAFMQLTFETGERQTSIEYRVHHADGSWRWHTSNAVPLKDKDGNVVAFEGSASDITERKRAEAVLRESNYRFVSFIKEAAMRLKNPLEVVEQNLKTIVNDVESGGCDTSNVSLQLRLQMKNVEQIRKNILELNTAIVRHSGDISAPEKKFLTE